VAANPRDERKMAGAAQALAMSERRFISMGFPPIYIFPFIRDNFIIEGIVSQARL